MIFIGWPQKGIPNVQHQLCSYGHSENFVTTKNLFQSNEDIQYKIINLLFSFLMRLPVHEGFIVTRKSLSIISNSDDVHD